MTVGDDALRGQWEPIDHQLFPASGHDKDISWKAQTHHIGGRMRIGGEAIPPAALRSAGSRRVLAGQTVEVTHMETKFDSI